MKPPKSPKERRRRGVRMTALSFALTGVLLGINGFFLPWSEEGALFALYGASVGFALALALSALGLWFFWKNKGL